MHLETAKTWEAIAAGQYGLLSRKQAEDVGLTPSRIKRLLARGSWIRALPKVYRAAAAPQSWRQPLMAACLWAKGKAVISGQSAAALWEFDGYWRTRVELSGLADLSAPPGVVYRRVNRLAPADIATHSGVRVTSVARTILDLAALVPRRTLERTLDEALRKDQVTLKALRWCIERNGRRGRTGVADLEALLHERRLQHAPDSANPMSLRCSVRIDCPSQLNDTGCLKEIFTLPKSISLGPPKRWQFRSTAPAFIGSFEPGRTINALKTCSSCTGGWW